jgi:hypothetical protein
MLELAATGDCGVGVVQPTHNDHLAAGGLDRVRDAGAGIGFLGLAGEGRVHHLDLGRAGSHG